jgi:hypothetical protein
VTALTSETNTSRPEGLGGFWSTAREFSRFASSRWFRNNPVRTLGLELAGVYLLILEAVAHTPWMAPLHSGATMRIGCLSLGLLSARFIHWRLHKYKPAANMKGYWDIYELIQHANISASEKGEMTSKLLEETLERVKKESGAQNKDGRSGLQ